LFVAKCVVWWHISNSNSKTEFFYCAFYNTCKDRWHITSNSDDSSDDNDDDNEYDNDNNKNIDKIIVIIVVSVLFIGPFEKPGLQATCESVR